MSQQETTSVISIRFQGSARAGIDFKDQASIAQINAQEPAPGKQIEVLSDDKRLNVHITLMRREGTKLAIGCVPII